MRTLLLASALFAGLFGVLAAGPVPVPVPVPYHAFCRAMWWVTLTSLSVYYLDVCSQLFVVSRLFATPCAEITAKLVQQIQAFNPLNACADCQYMVKDKTNQKSLPVHVNLDLAERGGTKKRH